VGGGGGEWRLEETLLPGSEKSSELCKKECRERVKHFFFLRENLKSERAPCSLLSGHRGGDHHAKRREGTVRMCEKGVSCVTGKRVKKKDAEGFR